jgi:hypothetical protein
LLSFFGGGQEFWSRGSTGPEQQIPLDVTLFVGQHVMDEEFSRPNTPVGTGMVPAAQQVLGVGGGGGGGSQNQLLAPPGLCPAGQQRPVAVTWLAAQQLQVTP